MQIELNENIIPRVNFNIDGFIPENPNPNQFTTCHFYPMLTRGLLVPIVEADIQILMEQIPAILHLPLNSDIKHIKNSVLRPILNCLPLGSVPMGLKRGRMQVHFLGIAHDQWQD